MQTWICLAVADEARVFGGNAGYDDVLSESYHWDSTVAHHAEVAVGDLIVLRDESLLMGASIIDGISKEPDRKLRRRCPECDNTDVRPRKSKQPTWRCYSGCGFEFREPKTELIDITKYTSDHAGMWVDLSGSGLTAQDLFSAQDSPRSQQSIRPASWTRIVDLLSAQNVDPGLGRLVSSLSSFSKDFGPDGGFTRTTARVRLGQPAFRRQLLEKFGPKCAFTGSQPEAVLEAAHLYSYAQVGVHHDQGGLLIRRDLHVLFDRGNLAVDPEAMRVDLDSEVRDFETYAALHGTELRVTPSAEMAEWLHTHWNRHRREPNLL